MADGAQSISKAVAEVFSDFISCFTLLKTSKKQSSSLKRHKDEPELWRKLRNDIFRLQKLSLNEESKEKLFGLLKDKWFDYRALMTR